MTSATYHVTGMTMPDGGHGWIDYPYLATVVTGLAEVAVRGADVGWK